MSVINTNITSMIGQQNLNASKSALTTSMERLSSGLRINSAKDDAAGQAIANRMSSQITGLSQAQRNANDGISVAQTAEGALNQVNDNIQRIRELSVQAQNGTNSQDDLTSIQNEIGQRLNEINRISEETSFNGVKVLQENNSLNIQVGANDGEAIEIDLKKINAETLGLTGFNVDGTAVANTKATEDDVKAAAGDSIATAGTGDAWDYVLTTDNKEISSAQAFSNLKDDEVSYTGTNNPFGAAATGVYAYDSESDSFSYDVNAATDTHDTVASAIKPSSGSVTATYELGSGNTIDVNIDSQGNITTTDGNKLYITDDGNLSQNDAGNTVDATIDNLMEAFDDAQISGGTAGTLDAASGANLTITSGELKGANFAATDAGNGVAVTGAKISSEDLLAASSSSGTNITANLSDTANTAIQISGDGEVTTDGTTKLYVDGTEDGFEATTDASYETNLYVGDDGSVTDAADGNGATLYVTDAGQLTFEAKSEGGKTEDPLEVLDKALSDVDALRSDLGAIQNRFESAITNLSTTETNLSAARSRIEDADYAVEVANMTRAQILQQAGTSVLAQANQVPQSVLSLLG